MTASICSFSKLQALHWVPERLTSGEEKQCAEYTVLELQRVSEPRGGFIKKQSSDSVGLGSSWRIYIYNKFLVMLLLLVWVSH